VPKGLLMVFTGNGKGKTTAALGMALRAMGHGIKVCVVQFIKGSRGCGEREAVQRFSDLMTFHVTGRGFTWTSDDVQKDKIAAREGWALACAMMADGRYGLVILDELTYLIRYGFLTETAVLAALGQRPAGQHVVITGRNASAGLLAAADLVTEMHVVKHPYAAGIKAQAGIEF
jgi:cob(I)alamin adenosyltransferase